MNQQNMTLADLPCNECPFKGHVAGMAGISDPASFLRQAHSESGIPCHLTQEEEEPKYCTGAIIAANKCGKIWRNPDLLAAQQALRDSPENVLGLQEFLDRWQEVQDLSVPTQKGKP